jgi:hypothetical protein
MTHGRTSVRPENVGSFTEGTMTGLERLEMFSIRCQLTVACLLLGVLIRKRIGRGRGAQ